MQLLKTYEPKDYETDIYALWEQSGAFTPKGKGTAYAIVVPPPNANGNLHIGHALTMGLQDIAVRYHRMKGNNTLFLPGADHAGFETQSVFEKQLTKVGKSRFDFSREELYSQIYDFVSDNRQNFNTQFRKLGASVDWQKFTFTLDEKIVTQAYATFKKMWDEKLIYRGERLVNYCTFHRTGFADIEVEHRDATTPLYYIKYGPFTLATTRPETKFGDTAVAVHPGDKRYAKWVGKVITVEGVNGSFDVQVIADQMVDPTFGTGVVKITPAHSFDDWEVSQRHNLPAVRVINHDGTMNHLAGRFEGLTVLEARKAIANAMEEQGLLEKVDEDYQTRIGTCYKCGTIIEPMLMEQWFIDMQPLAKPAIAALKANQITFYPEAKKDQLIGYLQNLRDWNISRQIDWGIPIPAFQNVDDSDDWIYDERVTEEIIEIDGKTYRRDPDVFDTWFSSSSWPYATLGLDSPDFKQFYPLSLMETGGEILYPWVSRMLMLGLYVTGKVPFENVYVHGYVMAEDGAKMSKSLGNVINPIEVIEAYGSDALRLGIIAGRSPAVNRGYDVRRVEEARNFCNKLWNIARYVESSLASDYVPGSSPQAETIADNWVLQKLQQASVHIGSLLDEYRFSEAYDHLYHFVWDDVADWYIEASKQQSNKQLLGYVLENVLKLTHPFAPFVTETIWQTLYENSDSLLIASAWPQVAEADTAQAQAFHGLQSIVTEARGLIQSLGLTKPTLHHAGIPLLEDNKQLLSKLAGLEAVTSTPHATGLRLANVAYDCWLAVEPDVLQTHARKLTEQIQTQKKALQQLEARLSNTAYIKNAPAHIVDQTKEQLQVGQVMLVKLQTEEARFKK